MKVPKQRRAYPWIEPSSTKTDAKYRVTADGHIRLVYIVDRRERALLTTDQHSPLVKMVAEVKREHGEPPSGVFYINEWRHVLVKAGGGTWYAGRYDQLLEFDLDETRISPVAPGHLSPGDNWVGPRVGVKYILKASGDDIYCRRQIRPGRQRDEYLSDYLASASEVVRRWAKHKRAGGSIYINEARELFAPVGTDVVAYTYLGRVPLDSWFPQPDVDNEY
ncbi:hypothetical protein O3597_20125 [Verrucosispora sp. WMMA2044]|uniref:hypothetical protein n=1 Tax=Verrucosispora sp. WMMA2044 TaxID=3016419 RepID=UPI00248CA5E3|nr:hypothetical protein [Verrucosispora sp. WMMA2044]WBB47436.1 hypothetical protein O3597_20125 [Verrucosispora sp. WMMA2044]